MKTKRMFVGILVLISFFCSFEFRAMAAEYPSKPINFYICHPPGGSADVVARPFANAAKQSLGQPFVLENKGGGGGTQGPQLVASKAPDGYTVGTMLNSTLVAYHMGKLNFNPMTDLTVIMAYAATLQGIAVRADAPWKTMKDLVEYARKNPGKVSYTSSGFGTTAHIPIENLADVAGIQLVHVPANGGAEMVPALLGGHVDFMSGSSANWMGLLEAGQVRLLATYGSKRAVRLPQIPTLQELGYDVVERNAHTLIGPKGMPEPIVKKIYDAFKKAKDDPAYRTLLKNLDMESLEMTQAESQKQVQSDFARYAKVLEKLDMKKK
jgi:tripartite-type tricarboxylate transporter receptor subunit TctC